VSTRHVETAERVRTWLAPHRCTHGDVQLAEAVEGRSPTLDVHDHRFRGS
jgi:hypothetical protein